MEAFKIKGLVELLSLTEAFKVKFKSFLPIRAFIMNVLLMADCSHLEFIDKINGSSCGNEKQSTQVVILCPERNSIIQRKHKPEPQSLWALLRLFPDH
jgi:hypothetical protein